MCLPSWPLSPEIRTARAKFTDFLLSVSDFSLSGQRLPVISPKTLSALRWTELVRADEEKRQARLNRQAHGLPVAKKAEEDSSEYTALMQTVSAKIDERFDLLEQRLRGIVRECTRSGSGCQSLLRGRAEHNFLFLDVFFITVG